LTTTEPTRTPPTDPQPQPGIAATLETVAGVAGDGDRAGGGAATTDGGGSTWRRSLAAAIREPDALLDRLRLPESFREPARRAAASFPVVVPESYLARMRPGDPDDPLLLQVLPLGAELLPQPGFDADPVGDSAALQAPGLLHKYAGRALLIAARECAIHCRYCFRRHYPYDETPVDRADWEPALAHLAGDPTIHELILSGGDPLVLSDRRLAELIDAAAQIPHLRRLRIHSRLPIVLPDRVDAGLLRLLTRTGQRIVMVVHANHPAELVGDCAAAVARLVTAGIPTLNQTVLLRRVNDDVDVLAELSERLVDLGVMPYYLHQLDRVAGAAQFEAAEDDGLRLIAALQARLPGYAVPRYVREVAGAASKLPVSLGG